MSVCVKLRDFFVSLMVLHSFMLGSVHLLKIYLPSMLPAWSTGEIGREILSVWMWWIGLLAGEGWSRKFPNPSISVPIKPGSRPRSKSMAPRTISMIAALSTVKCAHFAAQHHEQKRVSSSG